MTSQVVLPELGENIESADVSAVLVAVGDLIRRDQPLIEVETEKASLEVPAPTDGRVAELLVSAGDTIRVGQTILVVETAAEAASVPADTGPPPAEEPPAPESPVEAASTADEVAPPDDRGTDGAVLAFRAAARAAAPTIDQVAPAAPSVRALARELGLDILEVRGTGSGGRITRDDVKAHARRVVRGAAASGGGARAAAPAALPDFSRWGTVRREPLTRIRRATAERMVRSWAVPQVTQFDRADVTHLEELRRDLNRRPEAQGMRLSLTAVAIKMAAGALTRFPKFNASFDEVAGETVYKEYVHVGLAVETERGLLVPVLRDADRKPLLQVGREVTDLAERARSGKLALDEMSGAGFTVTNLGGLGTTWFSPIVNWPEVAILGLGRAEIRAVQVALEFRPRLILPLSISYDHRLIDGADAARFLRSIADALEQPLLLLLDGGRTAG